MEKKEEHKRHTHYSQATWVMENPDLRAVEKIILGEIITMHTMMNGFYKSNRKLSHITAINVRNVQKCIQSLKKRGYIKDIIEIRSEANMTKQRIIIPDIEVSKKLFEKYSKERDDKELESEEVDKSRKRHTPMSDATQTHVGSDTQEYNKEYNKNTINKRKVNKQSGFLESILGVSKVKVSKKIISKDNVFDYLIGTTKAAPYEEINIKESIPTSDDIDPFDYNVESKTGFHYGRKYNGDEIKKGDKVYVANQGISQHDLHSFMH